MNKNPSLAVLLAWLLPGAGHWYLGHRVRGAICCVLLLATFTIGVILTDGSCIDAKPAGMAEKTFLTLTQGYAAAKGVNPGRHPFAFLLQTFLGLPALVTWIATSGALEPPASKLNDFGMLLTLVAAALNVLLIADALYRTSPSEARDEDID